MRTTHARIRIRAFGSALAIMTGCASLHSAGGEAITGIDQIVGRWGGTIYPRA